MEGQMHIVLASI